MIDNTLEKPISDKIVDELTAIYHRGHLYY